MINIKRAADTVNRWGVLRFFPSEPIARAAIVESVCSMATSDSQIDWLGQKVLDTFSDWPGPATIREVFCNRFAPADGVDPAMPGGPMKPLIAESDKAKVLAMESAPQGQLLIGSGEKISKDPQIAAAAEIALGVMGEVSKDFSAPVTKEEIASAPQWLRDMYGLPRYENTKP
jgi:hypothetical protein